MNYIGAKHLVLTRIEQFLFLFIKCRHYYSISLDKCQIDIISRDPRTHLDTVSLDIYCYRCDKKATITINRKYLPSELPEALRPVERKLSESGNFHG